MFEPLAGFRAVPVSGFSQVDWLACGSFPQAVLDAASRFSCAVWRLSCAMNKPPRDPSPEEIRKACEEIRREWSEREHHRRAGLEVDDVGPLPYTVPVVKRVSGDSQ